MRRWMLAGMGAALLGASVVVLVAAALEWQRAEPPSSRPPKVPRWVYDQSEWPLPPPV